MAISCRRARKFLMKSAMNHIGFRSAETLIVFTEYFIERFRSADIWPVTRFLEYNNILKFNCLQEYYKYY